MKSAIGSGTLTAVLILATGCGGDGGEGSASPGGDSVTARDVAVAAGCTLVESDERYDYFEEYPCVFENGEMIVIQEWGNATPGNYMHDPVSSPMYRVDGSSVTFMMVEDDAAAQAAQILAALGVSVRTVEPRPLEAFPPQEPQIVGVGQTATVQGEEETATVYIHKISYPAATNSDPPMSKQRVLVAIEMQIVSTGQTPAYGMILYPDWQGADGRLIEDVGHHEAPVGVYGAGEYRALLPDEVSTGEDAQGWALYEVPKEPGTLIFTHGPSPFAVPIHPPA